MLGRNIKIHFAGSDGEEIFYASLTAAKTKYRLYSCYKYIVNKNLEEDFTLPENHVIKIQDKTNKQVIQDSGLFTLMFGAGKGKKLDFEYLDNWQNKLIKFVKQNDLKCCVVEVDCQKLLGVEDAWKLRKKLKQELPNNKIINVFHFEDGKQGLDRLIEFSDYIAISIPELRIIKPKTFREDAKYLVQYIRQKKPNIDIHLLGCTDLKMIKELNYCTSADSTSWLQGVKYGGVKTYRSGKKHVSELNSKLINSRKQEVLKILKERNVELKPKTLEYCTNASICATICKEEYTRVCGDQN